jgi:replicative DNA helicase
MSNKLRNAPAEHRLIGACLTDSNVIESVIDGLGPGDFSDPRMGSIYAAVARVALRYWWRQGHQLVIATCR